MTFEPTVSLGSIIGDLLVLLVLLRLYLYRVRIDARIETKIDMLLDLVRTSRQPVIDRQAPKNT